MKTRQSKTTRRRVMIVLAVGHLLTAGANANDAIRAGGHRPEPEEMRSSGGKPQIGTSIAPGDAFELAIAYRGAIKRLEKNESCRALFDGLMFGALQAMSDSRYRSPQSAKEMAHCAPGVAAYTTVGRSQIVVCKHFKTLQRRTKIAVLIHEALHNAGMGEAPADSDGMTAVEIKETVEEACALR